MKESKDQSKSEDSRSVWQKTQHANLIRYVPSGTLYARVRIQGKLRTKSLKTDRVTVAKMRLADFEKEERAKAEKGQLLVKGKLLMKDAIAVYEVRGYRPVTPRNQKDARPLKPAAVTYYKQRVDALRKTWPGFDRLEIKAVSTKDCERWADRVRAEMSGTAFNHTLGVLRNLFDFGIHIGARYGNPVVGIMRKEEPPKALELPDTNKFEAFVAEIENSGSGWSKPCADLVRFLAFGGFRLGEAKYITFGDCDMKRGQIIVRGHPETGLKNRKVGQTRTVPMIPDMRALLERLRAGREAKDTDGVMRVHECQKAMDRAAKEVGMKHISHHDLRHLFATRCIESGVDIPTVSRWLGHSDGGALAMRVYGHLRDQHSVSMAQRVSFSGSPAQNVVALPKEGVA